MQMLATDITVIRSVIQTAMLLGVGLLSMTLIVLILVPWHRLTGLPLGDRSSIRTRLERQYWMRSKADDQQ